MNTMKAIKADLRLNPFNAELYPHRFKDKPISTVHLSGVTQNRCPVNLKHCLSDIYDI